MSKKDKKRKKSYSPKRVRIPAFVAEYLPEYTEKARMNLELAELLPLQAVKNGEGSQFNLMSLAATLKLGALIERQLTRPAMAVLLEEGQNPNLKILDYVEANVRHIIPGKSPKEYAPAGEVITYLDGAAVRGRLSWEGDELMFENDNGRQKIEKAIVVYAV